MHLVIYILAFRYFSYSIDRGRESAPQKGASHAQSASRRPLRRRHLPAVPARTADRDDHRIGGGTRHRLHRLGALGRRHRTAIRVQLRAEPGMVEQSWGDAHCSPHRDRRRSDIRHHDICDGGGRLLRCNEAGSSDPASEAQLLHY